MAREGCAAVAWVWTPGTTCRNRIWFGRGDLRLLIVGSGGTLSRIWSFDDRKYSGSSGGDQLRSLAQQRKASLAGRPCIGCGRHHRAWQRRSGGLCAACMAPHRGSCTDLTAAPELTPETRATIAKDADQRANRGMRRLNEAIVTLNSVSSGDAGAVTAGALDTLRDGIADMETAAAAARRWRLGRTHGRSRCGWFQGDHEMNHDGLRRPAGVWRLVASSCDHGGRRSDHAWSHCFVCSTRAWSGRAVGRLSQIRRARAAVGTRPCGRAGATVTHANRRCAAGRAEKWAAFG